MVELGGVPLLHRQLAVMRTVGLTDVTVVAGFRAESVVAPGTEVIVNERFASSNMVASLFCAERVLTSGTDVVISYGDIAYEPRVLEAVLAAAGPLAVGVDLGWRAYWELRFADPLADAESLRLRPDGTIQELGQRVGSVAEIEGQYIGLLKLSAGSAHAFAEEHHRLRAEDGDAADAMYLTDFLQRLIDRGWRVAAAMFERGWLEIDSLTDLSLFERGALADFYDDRAAEAGAGPAAALG